MVMHTIASDQDVSYGSAMLLMPMKYFTIFMLVFSMIMEVPEEIREGIRKNIPVGRFGKPEDIARVVSFLAHEDASFITGTNVSANGGQYMH